LFAFQKCDYCGKQFKHRKNLLRHERELHSNNIVQSFSCSKCGTTYKRKRDCTAHELTCYVPKRKRQDTDEETPEAKRRRDQEELEQIEYEVSISTTIHVLIRTNMFLF